MHAHSNTRPIDFSRVGEVVENEVLGCGSLYRVGWGAGLGSTVGHTPVSARVNGGRWCVFVFVCIDLCEWVKSSESVTDCNTE